MPSRRRGRGIRAGHVAIEVERALGEVPEAPRDDDWTRIVEHRVRFADQIEPKGYERAFSDFYHAADRADLVALSFAPEAVFEQTPGPQAGRCVAGA